MTKRTRTRRWAAWTAVAGLGLLATRCQDVYLTAPDESSIVLHVNPRFVAAHGGVSEIVAVVTEPAGTPVADGTVVFWSTNLGRIDPETRTKHGFARANFVADSRSGIATVRAFSGRASATEEIDVGNIRVARVLLRADPPRITNSSSTHVFAVVFDTDGNTIERVPVYFDVVADPGTEFFDFTGPTFTNNNGEAENVMRTRRAVQGVAQVRARATGGGEFVTSETLRIPIL